MSTFRTCDLGVVSEGSARSSVLEHPALTTLHAECDPVSLRTVHALDELETLRELWNSWPGSRDSDLDFFSFNVRSRGPDCRPHVIVLSRSEGPEAILVGLRERRRVPVRMGQITTCQPMAEVLEFVHGGLRGKVSTENCTALVRHVMDLLQRGEADTAVWEKLETESPFYPVLRQLQVPVLREYFPTDDDHWVMNFPKGLDNLWANLPRSQRSKLRRKYRRVLKCFAGKIQVREFCSLADLEPAVLVMEEIARQSDKRFLGFGFFDTPQVREGIALAAKSGWLRIYVLYLEDKPAAFWMGTLYNRCLQADHVAHDRDWAQFSPGTFLFLDILDRLRDADISTVDFGRGSAQLKQRLAAQPRPEAHVHIYAPTAVGIKLRLLSTFAHHVTALWRHDYFPKWVKRALRGRLSRKQQDFSIARKTFPTSTDVAHQHQPAR